MNNPGYMTPGNRKDGLHPFDKTQNRLEGGAHLHFHIQEWVNPIKKGDQHVGLWQGQVASS